MNTSPFPSPEQRRADRAAKRHAVLAAAVAMFNERGFHATSLDDVAASLGISKPTIYHYLGNKDQVLLECLTMGLQQLIAAADAAHATPGRGLDRLQAFLRRYAEVNMDAFGACVIRTPEEALSPDSADRLRAMKREIDAAMRELIAEGMADGSIAPADPTLLAFTLAGALNWPARWYDPAGRFDAPGVAAQMVDILTAGIAPR
ncbi:TetR/AcrR family transcriptional regulator [Sphingomonas sp. GC_Shp_3]|uniref:TetR/AcrR family transcriptional regulator n=1 Tax=Sphingomonas sp. GC_Shp_3 TaxID=2937383 RepID=UPI00226A558C|nr:TetR/AcrR family transcriptional regulator [Sphingomonas sp. GC_Shp_3]